MKVKVLKAFTDLKHNVLREPETETGSFTCSEARYKEIVKGLGEGYVEKIEETKKEDKE